MSIKEPQSVKKFFEKSLDDALVFYKNISGKLEKKDEKGRLAAQTLMSVATIWECFLNDIIISYIVMDPENFFKYAQEKYERDITKSQENIKKHFVTSIKPKKISLEFITDVLDYNRRNISYAKVSVLKKEASKLISSEYVKGIRGIRQHDVAVIDLLRALRNFIAHGSDSSFDTLQKAVKNSHLDRYKLRRMKYDVNDNYYYLIAKMDRKCRVEKIISLIKDIGVNL